LDVSCPAIDGLWVIHLSLNKSLIFSWHRLERSFPQSHHTWNTNFILRIQFSTTCNRIQTHYTEY
jgi:hypothetical protein